MCNGICKTGLQCARKYWLDANGLCRDHKDQCNDWQQQAVQRRERRRARWSSIGRSFLDPLPPSIVWSFLHSPPPPTILSPSIPLASWSFFTPPSPSLVSSFWRHATPVQPTIPSPPFPLASWSFFTPPSPSLVSSFWRPATPPQPTIPSPEERFRKIEERLANAKKLLDSMNEDVVKMQQLMIDL